MNQLSRLHWFIVSSRSAAANTQSAESAVSRAGFLKGIDRKRGNRNAGSTTYRPISNTHPDNTIPGYLVFFVGLMGVSAALTIALQQRKIAVLEDAIREIAVTNS